MRKDDLTKSLPCLAVYQGMTRLQGQQVQLYDINKVAQEISERRKMHNGAHYVFVMQINAMKLYTPLVCRALQIAYNAHHGQTDASGVPYIYHPAFLAAQMDTEDEIITALLHDVVEDTPTTFEDLEREGFSDSVIAALRLLTHDDETEYTDYVRCIRQNALATKVKLADISHNSNPTRNANLPPEDAERYRKKYTQAIKLLEGSDGGE